jgi:hypothetical protein
LFLTGLFMASTLSLTTFMVASILVSIFVSIFYWMVYVIYWLIFNLTFVVFSSLVYSCSILHWYCVESVANMSTGWRVKVDTTTIGSYFFMSLVQNASFHTELKFVLTSFPGWYGEEMGACGVLWGRVTSGSCSNCCYFWLNRT